jgi:hypothetical protein
MACSGPTTELGKATGAQEATDWGDPCPTDAGYLPDGQPIPDGSYPSDVSTPPPDGSTNPWDASFDAPYDPDGSYPPDAPYQPDVYVPQPAQLILDGAYCAIIDTDGQTREWPHWGIMIHAWCPAAGEVRLSIDSYANISYPQTCSVATNIWLSTTAGIGGGAGEAGVDAGNFYYTYYEAGLGEGTCSVTSGPRTWDPSAGLAFTATVVDSVGLGFSRHVSYRADNAP